MSELPKETVDFIQGVRKDEVVEFIIDEIKITGLLAVNLDNAAKKRNVHPKQVLADIVYHVLNDDMIDAVLDD